MPSSASFVLQTTIENVVNCVKFKSAYENLTRLYLSCNAVLPNPNSKTEMKFKINPQNINI